MDDWRTFLYPLGFMSTLFFGARFIVQWLQSEKAHQSIVTRPFWQLSLLGNVLLGIHSLIQVQYHVCIVQVCNAIIAWRNLNLMQTKRSSISTQTVYLLLLGSIFLTSLAFVVQDWIFMREGDWFRVPLAPWQTPSLSSISFFWHALGAIAYLLFSSRFWLQWWFAEYSHTSQLTLSFWWLSLIGALLSIIYFHHIGDSVNLIGPLLGVVPYVRNMMLMRKKQMAHSSS